MKKLKTIVLETIPSAIGSLALAAMIFFTALNVILRATLHISVAWSEEYGYLMFCYAVFLGAAVCYRRHELISINVFVLMLPKKVQQFLFIFQRFAMCGINCYLLYLSATFAIRAVNKKTALMHIPYSIMDASIAVMFFFIVIYSFLDLYRTLTKADKMDETRHAE